MAHGARLLLQEVPDGLLVRGVACGPRRAGSKRRVLLAPGPAVSFACSLALRYWELLILLRRVSQAFISVCFQKQPHIQCWLGAMVALATLVAQFTAQCGPRPRPLFLARCLRSLAPVIQTFRIARAATPKLLEGR